MGRGHSHYRFLNDYGIRETVTSGLFLNTEFYTDKICSMKVSRPNLDRLMQGVRAGKTVRLVCYKLDRLVEGMLRRLLTQSHRYPMSVS